MIYDYVLVKEALITRVGLLSEGVYVIKLGFLPLLSCCNHPVVI